MPRPNAPSRVTHPSQMVTTLKSGKGTTTKVTTKMINPTRNEAYAARV